MQEDFMEDEKRRSYGKFGVGIFLITVGAILLLDKFDFLNTVSIWHYWPTILIAMGLGRLIDARFVWEFGKAFSLLFIGSWFFICELHLFNMSYHNAWPILLIGLGISILIKSFYPSCYKLAKDHCHGH